MTALLAQYLGADTIANRPATPDIALGFTAFFYAVDEGSLYVWQPAVDPDPGLWKAASPTLPAPADPGLYGWDADSQSWLVIPAGGIEEAPEDGTGYVRKDAGWVAESPAGLPSLVGMGGKFLKVMDDESGVEWDTPAGGGGGGSHPWYWNPPLTTDFTNFVNCSNASDDPDVGLSMYNSSMNNACYVSHAVPNANWSITRISTVDTMTPVRVGMDSASITRPRIRSSASRSTAGTGFICTAGTRADSTATRRLFKDWSTVPRGSESSMMPPAGI